MKLKLLCLISIPFLMSCQVYNSASKDKLLYGSGVDGSTNFGKAFYLLTSRCVSCHAEIGTFTTEAAWVSNGWVTAGNLNASKVYYRLNGASLGVAAEDMPVGSSLTGAELTDIRNWIENM